MESIYQAGKDIQPGQIDFRMSDLPPLPQWLSDYKSGTRDLTPQNPVAEVQVQRELTPEELGTMKVSFYTAGVAQNHEEHLRRMDA